MTIFRTLAVVRNLFARSGVRAIFRGLYLESDKKVRAAIWLVTIVYLGLPASLISEPNPFLPYGTAIALGLLFFAVVEWGLARHFSEEYAGYAIAGNRFSQSRVLLHYALFVRQLEESQLSTDDLRKISKWFESAEHPAGQESFLRHPLIPPVLALAGVLSAEILKSTEIWKQGNGFYLLVMLIALLFIASGVFGFLRRGRDSEQRLAEFIKWHLATKEAISEV